jgi:plasmid stability protein
MPVTLSVKNVPDELAERLRRRAAGNHRSLQRELLSILEAAVGHGGLPRAAGGPDGPRDAITIEELAEITDKLFPHGTSSSVDYIRRMRDRQRRSSKNRDTTKRARFCTGVLCMRPTCSISRSPT